MACITTIRFLLLLLVRTVIALMINATIVNDNYLKSPF